MQINFVKSAPCGMTHAVFLQIAGGSNMITIINPNSGPDYTGEDATVHCIPHLRKAGVVSIGELCNAVASQEDICMERVSFTPSSHAALQPVCTPEQDMWRPATVSGQ